MNPSLPVLSSGLTKTEIQQHINASVERMLDEGNVFEVAEALAAMEEFTKSFRKDDRYVGYLRDELQKNAGKLTTSSGAKLEACEVGVQYDYSQCNDWVLESLLAAREQLEKEIKERQDWLKTVPSEGVARINKDTGELIPVYPPAKKSTSSYKITLAR